MTYKHDKRPRIINNIVKPEFNILILSLITSFGIVCLTDSFDNSSTLGQTTTMGDEQMKINVQVTNNGDSDEIGSIHIIADETGISKDSNDISFAPGQTVIQSFEFSAEQIPVRTGFSVEVIYGDDYPKRVQDVISQSSEPEFISISIP